MPEIHHIKHLREKKGLSLSEIVRRHANVNKYGEVTVDGEAFVVHGIPGSQPCPCQKGMGSFHGFVPGRGGVPGSAKAVHEKATGAPLEGHFGGMGAKAPGGGVFAVSSLLAGGH
ncbi:hypothetical protein P4531_03920 [Geobacillus stearothermophilus]|uniref:hypothetical protein n=1 Tax=Geobacillus stearothermophilus TaxID=1422 RepID=UPI002EC6DFC2|nr:hypothetical protein [Geobacillus stearothermophilus]MED3768050.1 hypothetical protein [Geobacillus stearothermophilus]MED3771430.1 hypothetical protein [Geobacillus stearothermophilus]